MTTDGPAARTRPGWWLPVVTVLAAHPVAVVLVVGGTAAAVASGVGFLVVPVVLVAVGGVVARTIGPGILPGHTLDPEAEPALAALVARVASEVGFAQPLLIRLVPVPDASMASVRVQGVRARVMLLGLPLLRAMTEAELAGIVAHELAHDVHAHDLRTVASLRSREQLVESLDRLVHVPRRVAARLLRRSQPEAWAIEHAADVTAARVVGTAPVSSGLHRAGPVAACFHVMGGRWASNLGDDRYAVDLYDALDDVAADPFLAARLRTVADLVDESDPIGASSHPPVAAREAALPDVPDQGWPASGPLRLSAASPLEQWSVRALFGLDAAVRRRSGAPPAPSPVRVLDLAPEELEVPVESAERALTDATGTADPAAALAAAADVVGTPGWLQVAAGVDPDAAAQPDPGEREELLRESFAGCVARVLAGLLRTKGWGRGSRWSPTVVTGPDGTVDLRALVDGAVRTGDAAELRRHVAEATA